MTERSASGVCASLSADAASRVCVAADIFLQLLLCNMLVEYSDVLNIERQLVALGLPRERMPFLCHQQRQHEALAAAVGAAAPPPPATQPLVPLAAPAIVLAPFTPVNLSAAAHPAALPAQFSPYRDPAATLRMMPFPFRSPDLPQQHSAVAAAVGGPLLASPPPLPWPSLSAEDGDDDYPMTFNDENQQL